MVKEYFNKEPLKTVNVDEVVAVGATLAPILDLKIHDIITKTIGIEIADGKMTPIFEVKTVWGKNPKNKHVIKIYEGNDEIAKNNTFLGKFTLELDKNQKEKIVTILMELDHNSILKVIGKINDEKNNEITIKRKFDE